MGFLFASFYQFGDAFAFLVLSACGLAVIFGMMGVINLAHGEFIMCGAYVTVFECAPVCPSPWPFWREAPSQGWWELFSNAW